MPPNSNQQRFLPMKMEMTHNKITRVLEHVKIKYSETEKVNVDNFKHLYLDVVGRVFEVPPQPPVPNATEN